MMSNRKYIDGVISREDAPSGGNFGEYCLNSSLFLQRTCKQDGKEYGECELCPCFKPKSTPTGRLYRTEIGP